MKCRSLIAVACLASALLHAAEPASSEERRIVLWAFVSAQTPVRLAPAHPTEMQAERWVVERASAPICLAEIRIKTEKMDFHRTVPLTTLNLRDEMPCDGDWYDPVSKQTIRLNCYRTVKDQPHKVALKLSDTKRYSNDHTIYGYNFAFKETGEMKPWGGDRRDPGRFAITSWAFPRGLYLRSRHGDRAAIGLDLGGANLSSVVLKPAPGVQLYATPSGGKPLSADALRWDLSAGKLPAQLYAEPDARGRITVEGVIETGSREYPLGAIELRSTDSGTDADAPEPVPAAAPRPPRRPPLHQPVE